MAEMRAVVLIVLLFGGCASRPSTYVKTDGRPVDYAEMQSALARCKGEGATAAWESEMVSRSSKETAVVNACMSRTGYLAE
jgi:hypothetical protein